MYTERTGFGGKADIRIGPRRRRVQYNRISLEKSSTPRLLLQKIFKLFLCFHQNGKRGKIRSVERVRDVFGSNKGIRIHRIYRGRDRRIPIYQKRLQFPEAESVTDGRLRRRPCGRPT